MDALVVASAMSACFMCAASLALAFVVAKKKHIRITFSIQKPGASQPKGQLQVVNPRNIKRPAPGSALTKQGLLDCLKSIGSVRAQYSFVKGSDGLLYLMNQDEPDAEGWLRCIVNMRTSIVPILGIVQIAPDNAISSDSDGRLSATEFKRIAAVLNDRTYSGIGSMSSSDLTSFFAVTSCNGRGVFLTSKDYHAKGWRQENIVYTLHELCHVAMGGPPEEVAHNLEFFRVMNVLTRAAMSLGPSVYNERWYNWDKEANREALGGWIGTDSWYAFAKKVLKSGFRWNGPRLERGRDPFIPESKSLVKVS